MSPDEIEFSDVSLDGDIEKAINDLPIAHFGLPQIDSQLDGLRRNSSLFIAGGPGVGKTSLANQFALDLAAQGLPVVFASYEMKNFQLTSKSLANVSEGKLKERDIAGCSPFSKEYEALSLAKEKYLPLARNILRIDDCSTIEHLTTLLCKIRKQRHQTPVFICDYCQIARYHDDERCDDLASRTAVVAEKLFNISHQYNIPVIVTSMVVRGSFSKEKVDSDVLSGSTRLEYGADAIIRLKADGGSCLHDENTGARMRRVKVSILKNRKGDQTPIDLDFYPEFARFRETPLSED